MKKHKIKFGTASNGQEALDKWNGGGYHLILVSCIANKNEFVAETWRLTDPHYPLDGYPTACHEWH